MSGLVQVQNIRTKDIIEVPFAHALGVLIPQGNYKLYEAKLVEALNDPIERETGKANFDDKDINLTRAELMDILDKSEVKYTKSANKAELLSLIKTHRLIGVHLEAAEGLDDVQRDS